MSLTEELDDSFKPPSDEGGVKTVGFDGGRENLSNIASFLVFSANAENLSLSQLSLTAAYGGGLPLSLRDISLTP